MTGVNAFLGGLARVRRRSNENRDLCGKQLVRWFTGRGHGSADGYGELNGRQTQVIKPRALEFTRDSGYHLFGIRIFAQFSFGYVRQFLFESRKIFKTFTDWNYFKLEKKNNNSFQFRFLNLQNLNLDHLVLPFNQISEIQIIGFCNSPTQPNA